MQTVYLVATAHAVVIRVSSPVEVDDLVLHVVTDGAPPKDVGPLPALAQPGGGFMYEHTLYMADVSTNIFFYLLGTVW